MKYSNSSGKSGKVNIPEFIDACINTSCKRTESSSEVNCDIFKAQMQRNLDNFSFVENPF